MNPEEERVERNSVHGCMTPVLPGAWPNTEECKKKKKSIFIRERLVRRESMSSSDIYRSLENFRRLMKIVFFNYKELMDKERTKDSKFFIKETTISIRIIHFNNMKLMNKERP